MCIAITIVILNFNCKTKWQGLFNIIDCLTIATLSLTLTSLHWAVVSIGFGTINCFVFAGDWCTTQTTIIVGAFRSCALIYTTAMFLFCFIIGIQDSGISIPQSPNFDVVMFKVICRLPLLPLITRRTMNKPWDIDFARAKSEAPIYAFYFNFIQWSLNNCKVIHKFILNFRGQLYEWKTETWACNHLKANNWSAENFKKNTWPQWVFLVIFWTCCISVLSFIYNLC